MEMDATMVSQHKNNSSSSTIRFLGILKQPDSESSPFELDESDVVWSSDQESADPNSPSLSTVSNSPTNHRNQLVNDHFGLSAALSDERRPLVRRKPALNPSLSAVSAARTIPPVPVPLSRSSSGPGKFHQSAPVNVPIWPKANGRTPPVLFEDSDMNNDEEEEEMLPPHEIVARSQVTTFSVFEGVGRTLKGRDLRQVRNAVWQKTGFLD